MSKSRAERILVAIETLGERVWRQTRYGNDTGTTLWVSTGTLVMVPDQESRAAHCQGPGATELHERLRDAGAYEPPRVEPPAVETPVVPEPALGTATPRAMVGDLLRAADALVAHGAALGLARARGLLKVQLEARFGPLPDPVQARLEAATFEQLEAWAPAVLTANSAARALL